MRNTFLVAANDLTIHIGIRTMTDRKTRIEYVIHKRTDQQSYTNLTNTLIFTSVIKNNYRTNKKTKNRAIS